MKVSEQQAAANLANLVRATRETLELPPKPAAIPRERIDDYLRAMSAAILADSDSYTDAAVSNAKRNINASEVTLLENGILTQAGEFVSAVGDNVMEAADAAADVGRGVINTAKLVRWALPLAVLVAVGLFIWRRFGASAVTAAK